MHMAICRCRCMQYVEDEWMMYKWEKINISVCLKATLVVFCWVSWTTSRCWSCRAGSTPTRATPSGRPPCPCGWWSSSASSSWSPPTRAAASTTCSPWATSWWSRTTSTSPASPVSTRSEGPMTADLDPDFFLQMTSTTRNIEIVANRYNKIINGLGLLLLIDDWNEFVWTTSDSEVLEPGRHCPGGSVCDGRRSQLRDSGRAQNAQGAR